MIMPRLKTDYIRAGEHKAGIRACKFYFMFGIILILSALISYLISKTSTNYADEYRVKFANFLSLNDGKKFFCYTSRNNSKEIIESQILSQLDKDISIIFLDGKKPISEYPVQSISWILYRIKNIGFPNIMKIENGKVIDISLKREFYHAINTNTIPDFIKLLHLKFDELDQKAKEHNNEKGDQN
jgi:hypothetical protein